MAQDNIKNLYEALKNDYDLGSEQDFRQSLGDAGNRRNLYNSIKDDYDLGSEQDFNNSLGYGGDKTNGANGTNAPKPAAPKPMTRQEYGSLSPVAQEVADGVGMKPEERDAMGLTESQRQAIVDNVKNQLDKPLPTYEQNQAEWERQQHEAAIRGAEMKETASKNEKLRSKKRSSAEANEEEPTLEEKAAQGEYIIENARENLDAPYEYRIDKSNPNTHIITIDTKDYTDRIVNGLYAEADAEKQRMTDENPDYSAWGDDNGMRATQRAMETNKVDDPKRMEELAWKKLKEDEQAIKEKAAQKAHELQANTDQYIDVNDFANETYQRTCADTIAKIRNMAVEREKPHNTFEGVMGGIDESIVGNFANSLTTTPEHIKARQQAADEWRQNAGVLANVGRSTAAFVADTPFFGVSGELSGATVRQIAKQQLEKYVARGLSEKAAARVIQTKLANSFGKRMADTVMKGVAGGAVNLGTYEGMSEAANQIAVQEFKPEEIMKSVAHGATTGSVLGVTGGAWGEATAKLSGAKKILANVAGFGIEAGTFTATGEFEKWASGQGDQINWLEDFGENAAMILAMKASNPKHLLQIFNPKARQEPNVPKFSDAERNEILSSRGGRELYDLVNEGKSSKEEYAQAYERFVNDPDVSFTSKQKVSYALTESMQRKTPEVTTYDIDTTEDGKAILSTRAADGMIVEKIEFSTPEAAEKYGERLTAAIMQGETSRYSLDAGMAAAGELKQEMGISDEKMQNILTGEDKSEEADNVRRAFIDRFNLLTTEREMNDAGRIEEQRALPETVENNLHEDGTVHKATLYPSAENGGAPQEVFITKGDIVMREDGTVDTEASSEMICYKDVDGNTHMASPDKFQRAEMPVSAEEVAAADAGANGTDVRNEAVPTFNMDDEVSITDADGNTRSGVVSGTFKAGDRHEITVDYEDENGNMKRVELPYDELARMNGYEVADRAIGTNETDETNETLAEVGMQEQAPAETEIIRDITREGEGTPQTERTPQAEAAQPTAEQPAVEPMPMVKDKNGVDTDEPDFTAVEPQRTHAYLYNEAELSREEADGFVKANVEAAQKALDKVRKKEPKMGTSISAYKAAKAAIADELAEARQQVDYWNAVKAEQAKVVAAERTAQAERDKAIHDAAVENEKVRIKNEELKEAERAAVGNENPMPQITEKWNAAPKVDGVADEVVLANGEKVAGHYVLTESGAATPSHQSTLDFQKSEGFPMDRNGNTVNDRDYDRDYERDKEAQDFTRNIAAQYDSRALQTPVVVSQDGVVLSGNGRTMAGELAARDNTDAEYNNYLAKYANKYGFTPEQVGQMQHPRVVFVPDERMPYTADTFSKFNQNDMKSQSKTEQSVKLGKIVDDDVFNRMVRTINTFDTLGDFYNDAKAANEAIKELQTAGVITPQQTAEMYDGDGISAIGREILENTLIGKAFESNPEAVRMITEFKGMRRSVITALSEIANNVGLGKDYSLEEELTAAVKLCYDARHAGYKEGEKVSNFARQTVLFGKKGETVADYQNATMKMLADLLNDQRSTLLKKTLAVYNKEAHDSANGQTSFLYGGGIQSKEDILKDVLNILNHGTNEQQQSAINTAVEQRKADAASVQQNGDVKQGNQGSGETEISSNDRRGGSGRIAEWEDSTPQNEEVDENGRPFVKAADGTTVFGEIREDSGLTPAPIKLSEGYQDEDGKGYGLAHIEANHGEQIRNAGFASVEEFVAYVAQNYDEDNIRVGKRRENGSPTYLIQITDTHDNTLFIEMSKDGSYWNVNSAEIFRIGYSNKKETVAKTEPQQPNNAVSTGSSLSEDEEGGITSSEPNGKPTVSDGKVTESSATEQGNERNSSTYLYRSNVTGDARRKAIDKIVGEAVKCDLLMTKQGAFRQDVLHKLHGNANKVYILQDANTGEFFTLAYTPEEAYNTALDYDKESFNIVYWDVANKTLDFGEYSYRGDNEEDAARDERGALKDDVKQSVIAEIGKLGSGRTIADVEKPTTSEAIQQAEQEVNTNPTEAQKEAGNYRKGHVKVDGYDITIEQPKGSVRTGKDEKGNILWRNEMHNTYGYIRGTEGTDGDHIDIFLSDNPEEGNVYVIDQVNPKTGEFDDHKVMYGFNSMEEAREAYLSNYEKGWKGLSTITEVSKDEFKKWIDSSHRKTKPFAEYKSVKPTAAMNEGKAKTEDKKQEDKRKKKNKLGVSEEEKDDALKKLRDMLLGKGENITAGLDLNTLLEQGGKLARYYVGNGLEKFADFAKTMYEDMAKLSKEAAEQLKPYIKRIYMDLQGDMTISDEITDRMDDAKTVRKFNMETLGKKAPSPIDTAKTLAKEREVEKNADLTNDINETTKKGGKIFKQWQDIKKKHPDALLLFRAGDFYETYNEDAQKACDLLGLTLTHSNDGEFESMAGFPYHALDDYLPKLVRAGQRVAICDQLEEPKKAGVSKENERNRTKTTESEPLSAANIAKAIIAEKEKRLEYFNPERHNAKFLLNDLVRRWAQDYAYKYFEKHPELMKNAELLNKVLGDEVTSDSQIVNDIREALEAIYKNKQTQQKEDEGNRKETRETKKSGEAKPTERDLFSAMEEETKPMPEKPKEELKGNSEEYQRRARQEHDFVNEVAKAIYATQEAKPLTMSDVKKLAEKYDTLTGISTTDLQELVELAMTKLTHTAALQSMGKGEEAERAGYDKIVSLYNAQPLLNTRDTTIYETKKGKKVRYRSANPAAYEQILPFAEDGDNGGTNDGTRPSDVQRQGDELTRRRGTDLRAEEGEFCHVERVFRESGAFNFTAGEKIESAADVAYIFTELEDAAVENAFVVMVKDGQPTVVHVGVGNFNTTMVNQPVVRLACERIQPDKVYFVHNHPSGNVKCSYQDANVLKNMKTMLGTDVEGVIINLKSGKYGVFDTEMRNETRTKPTIAEGEHPIKLYSFDKQVFSPDYEPQGVKLDSAEKVAAFVSSHRLGDRKKLSFLVVNNALGVTANIHTPYTKIDDSDKAQLANDISKAITEFGGATAFVYGDFAENRGKYGDTILEELNKEVNRLSGGAFKVQDLVKIEGNNTKSAMYGDVFEPRAEYGSQRLNEEERCIAERAKKDGTYMKAPNGKPTKLTEKQWAQVRTNAFKDWFGDWEKSARIEKLRESEAIEITGDEYKGKYDLNRDSAQDWIKANLRGEYTNKDTGEKISISRVGANKVTSHSMSNETHLKSIAAIPQLIEKFIFIEEIPNTKNNSKYDSYRYYVCGLKIDGEDYTVKIIIGVKQGKKYYDHSLTQIEKGTLIDSIDLLKRKFADKNADGFITTGDAPIPSYTVGKDTKLLSILQTNSSKVVDENGEPMVVYHGTNDAGFKIFNRSDKGIFFSNEDRASWYVTSEDRPQPIQFVPKFNNWSEVQSYAQKHNLTFEEADPEVYIEGCYFINGEITDNLEEARDILQSIEEENYEGAYYPVFLNIRNPRVIDAKGKSALDIDQVRNNSKQDGVIVKDVVDPTYDEGSRFEATNYVVFDPNQIKSATDNNGNFSREDDNILHESETSYGSRERRYTMDDMEQPAPMDGESPIDYARRLGEWHDRMEAAGMVAHDNGARYGVGGAVDTYWRDMYDEATLSNGFKFREAAQDGMLSVTKLQETIAKETGKDIAEDEDVWALQNRLSSTNKFEQEYYGENYFKPLMNAVRDLVKQGAKYNVKGEDVIKADSDVTKYVIAKHGLERNEYFREKAAQVARRPFEDAIKETTALLNASKITALDAAVRIADLQVKADDAEQKSRAETAYMDYSGLTELFENASDWDVRAQAYVAMFENDFDTIDLWNRINAATKESLKKTYEAGLISREGYETARDMFQYYIPLRSWANDVASEHYHYKGGSGEGGRIVKHMRGRRSLAEDPLATIGRMGQDAILQANKNEVKKRLYNLAMGHDTTLLTVKRQWYQNMGTKKNPDWQRVYPDLRSDMTADEVDDALKDFDDKMRQLKQQGMATQRRKGLTLGYHTTQGQEQQHRVNVSIGGREYNIYVNGNPRAAQAINGELRMEDDNKNIIQKANRWLSSVYTSLNPEFVVTNYERDAGFAASIVAATEPAAYQAAWVKNMAKYNPVTTGVHLNSLINKATKGQTDPNNKAEVYMLEFLKNGGETGFTNMLTVDDYKKLIQKEVKKVNAPISMRQARHILSGAVERANRVFEDATRFATYVTSREQGRGIDRAIRDAKEISLNFNTRGADGMKGDSMWHKFFRNLRRWIIFSNPSIQGLNKAGVAFKSHPVRSTIMIAGLPTLLGYCMSMTASAILGDDDNEEVRNAYMDLPKWVRRSNLCIPIGGTKFVTIPWSYELRVSYGMGEMLWEIEQGQIEPGEMMKETLSQLSDLLPLSFASGTVAQNASPSVIRPWVDIVQNKDFTGKALWRDNGFNKNMPEYTKAYAGTSTWLTKSAEVLNNSIPKIGGTQPDKYTPGLININPGQVEHILNSYMGGLFTFPNKTEKAVQGWIFGDEDMQDIRNIPFLSRNIRDSKSGNPINKGQGDRYRKYMDEYKKTKQRFSGYRREVNHGVTEFVPKLVKFYSSPEYKRMVTIDTYKKTTDKIDQQVKAMGEYEGYGNDNARLRLKKVSDSMKQEMVEQLERIK